MVVPKRSATVRMFAPELWGEVDRFSRFHDSTYKFSERDRRAVGGVGGHFEKAVKLTSLASKLLPNLETDRRQIEELGYTPGENAAEVAAVVEAALLEIYSSIDCTVKVLRAIYGKGSRKFKNSTRSFFASFEQI